MQERLIIPAQIRAGRALIGWSQEQLAKAAGVALSSVRDIESQKRAPESEAAVAIRAALVNAGVVFISGGAKEGPGVRLIANRPNIIRRPTTVTMWEGVPFTIEWQGKPVTAFVSSEALEDLGRLKANEPPSVYLAVFEKNVGTILDGVKNAIRERENFDRQGRLHVRSKNIPELE